MTIPTMVSTIEALVAAEYAFAAAAKANGTKPAFLEHLADDAILFRPAAVNGKAWWEEQPLRPGLLAWYPAYAGIAASGDMGLSTGPWEFWPPDATEPYGFGHYISVWQLQPDGQWKVVIDTGIQVALGPAPTDGIYAHWSLSSPAITSDKGSGGAGNLLQADQAFATAVQQNPTAAYVEIALPEIRLYRDEHHPFVGQDALAAGVALWKGPIEWTPRAIASK